MYFTLTAHVSLDWPHFQCSVANAVFRMSVFPSIDVLGYPTYGVPTIRSDLPAPLIRRVSDRTSYGEEGNAYSLLHPTIFAQKGVFERDFFKTRSKQEVPHGISEGLKERPTSHWHAKMERFICLSSYIMKVIRSCSD